MNASTDKITPLVMNDTDHHYTTLCADLAHSRTVDNLKQRIHAWTQRLGFTDYLFVRLERCWQTDTQKGLLTSFPSLWLQCYQENKLNDVDVLLSYGKTNTDPIFSSQIYQYINGMPFNLPLTCDNRRVCQLYKRFNYFDHYVIPMPACNGNGHVLLLLTSAGIEPQEFYAKVEQVTPASRALCRAIDTVSTQKFRSSFIQHCDQPWGITHKQLKILRSLANEDYTITALAHQLCISPTTAHQHVAEARKALHTKTTIRAVVKAIKAGLIAIQKYA